MKDSESQSKRTIFCQKLKKEGTQLDKPPFRGTLGERIYQDISKEAFQLWLKQQTILINEHRLKMSDAKSRQFLMEEMEKFLFREENIK